MADAIQVADEHAPASSEGLELAEVQLTAEELLERSKEQLREGDATEAMSSAQEALVLFRDNSDSSGEVLALCAVSQLHLRIGDNQQALETARQMRTFSQSIKSREGEAMSLVEIANAHLAEHEARPAARAAGAAVKLSTKHNLPDVRVQGLLKVVEAELQLLGDLAGIPATNSKMQQSIDAVAAKAYASLQEALKLADCVEQFVLLGQLQYWNGKVMLVVGQEAEAREAAAKARTLFQRVGEKFMEGEALIVLTQAEHRLDSSKDWASNAAHDALDIFQKLDNQQAMDRTYQLFQDLGIALRVAGGVAPVAALQDGSAPAAVAAQGAVASVAVVAATKGLDTEDVMATVQVMAKAAIGLDEELYFDSPLMDSGLDSLTAVSFRNGLQQQLGVKLPSSLMFDYPTMKDLSHRIVELSLEDE